MIARHWPGIVGALALAVWVLFICGGCWTPGPGETGPTIPDVPLPNEWARTNDAPVRRMVVATLGKVDPRAYGGWTGECPGTDVDAELWRDLARICGWQAREYRDAAVTRAGFGAAVRAAAAGLRAGDWLAICYSGHGGQIADYDGDEASRYDSTLCLWDGQLLDDDVWTLLEELPAGCDVFLCFDSCHSGSAFRSRYAPVQPRGAFSLRAPAGRRGQGVQARLTYYGAAQDDEYAYGSADGGAWVGALYEADPERQSWAGWFEAARKRVKTTQHPRLETYNQPDLGRPALGGVR